MRDDDWHGMKRNQAALTKELEELRDAQERLKCMMHELEIRFASRLNELQDMATKDARDSE